MSDKLVFHEIFSKTSKEVHTLLVSKIIIDFREKNSRVPSFLAEQKIPFEFVHLEVGDYIVNNTLIERKSLSDLEQSIINKRIFSQISQMNSQPQDPLLIIEKSACYRPILHPNALRGFFLSLSKENKVPYIFSEDERDTSFYLSLLAKHKASQSSLRPKRTLKTTEEIKQFVLEGFPNIGPAKSKALLTKFKSLSNIFNASIVELEEILWKDTLKFKELLSLQEQ